MKDYRTYDRFQGSVLLIFLGLELSGVSVWYFGKLSLNPYDEARKSLVVAVVLFLIILLGAVVTVISNRTKRTELGFDLPQRATLLENLKFTRWWKLSFAVILVLPLLLFFAWIGSLFPESEALKKHMANQLIVGILTALLGLGDLSYSLLRALFDRDS